MTNIAFMATLLATFQRGRNEPMFARCGGGRIEEGLFPEDADEQTTACRPTFQLTLTLMPLAQNRVNSFERGKRSVSSFDKLSSLVCMRRTVLRSLHTTDSCRIQEKVAVFMTDFLHFIWHCSYPLSKSWPFALSLWALEQFVCCPPFHFLLVNNSQRSPSSTVAKHSLQMRIKRPRLRTRLGTLCMWKHSLPV